MENKEDKYPIEINGIYYYPLDDKKSPIKANVGRFKEKELELMFGIPKLQVKIIGDLKQEILWNGKVIFRGEAIVPKTGEKTNIFFHYTPFLKDRISNIIKKIRGENE